MNITLISKEWIEYEVSMLPWMTNKDIASMYPWSIIKEKEIIVAWEDKAKSKTKRKSTVIKK